MTKNRRHNVLLALDLREVVFKVEGQTARWQDAIARCPT